MKIAIFVKNHDAAIAIKYYSIDNDIKELKGLLFNSTGTEAFMLTGKSDNPMLANSADEKSEMLRVLNKSEAAPNDVYIGITLM